MRKMISGLAGGLVTLILALAPSLNARDLTYNEKDVIETGDIVYAESANQPGINRRLVARTIINRAKNDNFPETPYQVIHQKNAFSCVGQGSKLWKQAKGKIKMKKHEREAYNSCHNDVQDVYAGRTEGIEGEDKIIAYHDVSITKPKGDFWNSLEKVYQNGRLIFYAPRK